MYKIIIIICLLCATTVRLKRIDDIQKFRVDDHFNGRGLSSSGIEYPSPYGPATRKSIRLTRAKRSPLVFLVPVNEEHANVANEMTERIRPSRKIKRCKTSLCRGTNPPLSGEYRDGTLKATAAGESSVEPYGAVGSTRWKKIRTGKNSVLSKLFRKKETDSWENEDENVELVESLGRRLVNEPDHPSDRRYREERSGKFVCYCRREDCPDCRSSGSRKELVGSPRRKENILGKNKFEKDRYRKLLPSDYAIPKIPRVRLPELYREIPYDLGRNHGNSKKMQVLPIVRGIPSNVHPLTVPFRVAYEPTDTYVGAGGPLSQQYQQGLNNNYRHVPLKQYALASKSKSDIPRGPSASMTENNRVGSRNNNLSSTTSDPKENDDDNDDDNDGNSREEEVIDDDTIDPNMQECIKLFGRRVCVLAAATNCDNLSRMKNEGDNNFVTGSNKNVGSARNYYETSSVERSSTYRDDNDDYYDVTRSDMVSNTSPYNVINFGEDIDDHREPTELSLRNYYDDYYDSTVSSVISDTPEYVTVGIDNDRASSDDYYDSDTPKYVNIDSTEAAILGITSNQEKDSSASTTTVLTDTDSSNNTEYKILSSENESSNCNDLLDDFSSSTTKSEDEKSTDATLGTMLTTENESSTYGSQNENNNDYSDLLYDDFTSSTTKTEDEKSTDTTLGTMLTTENESSTYGSQNENNNDRNDLLYDDFASSTTKTEDEKSTDTTLGTMLRTENESSTYGSQNENNNDRNDLLYDDFTSSTTKTEDEKSTDTTLGTMLTTENESSTYGSQNENNNDYNDLLYDDFASSTTKTEDEKSTDTTLGTMLTTENESSTYESQNENNNDYNDLLYDDFGSSTIKIEDGSSTDSISDNDINHYVGQTHPGLDYSDIQVVTNGYFTSKGYDESDENYLTGLTAYDYHRPNDDSLNLPENSPPYDPKVPAWNIPAIFKDQGHSLSVSPTKIYADLAKSQLLTDSSTTNNVDVYKTITEDGTNLLEKEQTNCVGQERGMNDPGKESALRYDKFDPSIVITTNSESRLQESTTNSFLGYTKPSLDHATTDVDTSDQSTSFEMESAESSDMGTIDDYTVGETILTTTDDDEKNWVEVQTSNDSTEMEGTMGTVTEEDYDQNLDPTVRFSDTSFGESNDSIIREENFSKDFDTTSNSITVDDNELETSDTDSTLQDGTESDNFETTTASLPFCDNTVLLNSIRSVINNFAMDSTSLKDPYVSTDLTDEELSPEILEIPNLRSFLSLPQIENVIVKNVKNHLLNFTGLTENALTGVRPREMIRNALRNILGVLPGTRAEIPPMTVEEHQFKNNQWTTNLVTLLPLEPSKELEDQNSLRSIHEHIKDLIFNPAVGLQAAKQNAVQNIIVQAVKHHMENFNGLAVGEDTIRDIVGSVLGNALEPNQNGDSGDDLESNSIMEDTTTGSEDTNNYDEATTEIVFSIGGDDPEDFNENLEEITVGVPLITNADYIETATGSITELNTENFEGSAQSSTTEINEGNNNSNGDPNLDEEKARNCLNRVQSEQVTLPNNSMDIEPTTASFSELYTEDFVGSVQFSSTEMNKENDDSSGIQNLNEKPSVDYANRVNFEQVTITVPVTNNAANIESTTLSELASTEINDQNNNSNDDPNLGEEQPGDYSSNVNSEQSTITVPVTNNGADIESRTLSELASTEINDQNNNSSDSPNLGKEQPGDYSSNVNSEQSTITVPVTNNASNIESTTLSELASTEINDQNNNSNDDPNLGEEQPGDYSSNVNSEQVMITVPVRDNEINSKSTTVSEYSSTEVNDKNNNSNDSPNLGEGEPGVYTNSVNCNKIKITVPAANNTNDIESTTVSLTESYPEFSSTELSKRINDFNDSPILGQERPVESANRVNTEEIMITQSATNNSTNVSELSTTEINTENNDPNLGKEGSKDCSNHTEDNNPSTTESYIEDLREDRYTESGNISEPTSIKDATNIDEGTTSGVSYEDHQQSPETTRKNKGETNESEVLRLPQNSFVGDGNTGIGESSSGNQGRSSQGKEKCRLCKIESCTSTHEIVTKVHKKVKTTTRKYYGTKEDVASEGNPIVSSRHQEEDRSNVVSLEGKKSGEEDVKLSNNDDDDDVSTTCEHLSDENLQNSESDEDLVYNERISRTKTDDNDKDDLSDLQNAQLYYIGDNVKLPLEIKKLKDGSYALSISKSICENVLKRKCPCCVPLEGNVRSVRRTPKINGNTDRVAGGRKYSKVKSRTSRQRSRRSTVPNRRSNWDESISRNDLETLTMPVETFAKKYNLRLNLDDGEIENDTADQLKRLSGIDKNNVDIESRKRLIEQLNKIKRDQNEFEGRYDIRRDEDDRLENIDTNNPVFQRMKFVNRIQKYPEMYRRQRATEGSPNGRTEIIKNVLNWFRTLLVN